MQKCNLQKAHFQPNRGLSENIIDLLSENEPSFHHFSRNKRIVWEDHVWLVIHSIFVWRIQSIWLNFLDVKVMSMSIEWVEWIYRNDFHEKWPDEFVRGPFRFLWTYCILHLKLDMKFILWTYGLVRGDTMILYNDDRLHIRKIIIISLRAM